MKHSINVTKSNDKSFSWITQEYGNHWKDWEEVFRNSKCGFNAKYDLASFFFKDYLLIHAPYAYKLSDFLEGTKDHKCTEDEFKEINNKKFKETSAKKNYNTLKSVIQFMIDIKYTDEEKDGVLVPKYFNPFDNNHEYCDPKFRWITKYYGKKWEAWRKYFEEFFKTNHPAIIHYTKISNYRRIRNIFEGYIFKELPHVYNIKYFFTKKNAILANREDMRQALINLKARDDIKKTISLLTQLINWIIDKDFSEIAKDRIKIPLYNNPLSEFAINDRNEDFVWIVKYYGFKWNSWRILISQWFKTINKKEKKRVKGDINTFIEHYLLNIKRDIYDVESYFKNAKSVKYELAQYYKLIQHLGYSDKTNTIKLSSGRLLMTWILENNYYKIKENGYKELLYSNPLITKFIYSRYLRDESFLWIDGAFGKKWINWRLYIKEYYTFEDEKLELKNINIKNRKDKLNQFKSAICIFFESYMQQYPNFIDIKTFFESREIINTAIQEYESFSLAKGYTKETARVYAFAIKKILDWILDNHFWKIENDNKILLYRNPFSAQGNKGDDLDLYWLIDMYGKEWNEWRIIASKWIKEADTALDGKLSIISFLFENYLIPLAPYTTDIISLFTGNKNHICSSDELNSLMKEKGYKNNTIATKNRYISLFITWVIENYYSEENEFGKLTSKFKNPFTTLKEMYKLNETIRIPLPYSLIKECREIISGYPSDSLNKKMWNGKNFSNWTFSQLSFDSVDWINVPETLIDKNDPDCVWRKRETITAGTYHEIWSPVRAMSLFIKLHLPLRTYQVRFLDSGEADTWRYTNKKWVINDKHNFAIINESNTYEKGVFRKIYDYTLEQFSLGLYINTNKTADQNKNDDEKGYIIPWDHEEIFYWLEKLRNWQEKYNPITSPTKCTSLNRTLTGNKKSYKQLEKMGEICFLFRNPCSKKDKDKDKPITSSLTENLWYKTLKYLEDRLKNKYSSNENNVIKLIKDDSDSVTYFPLHSLRVSLITAYAMYTSVPLPVISKLLAGHTRLLMTVYYNKLTPAVMRRKMDDATEQLNSQEDMALKDFLAEQSLKHTECNIYERSIVYNNLNSIENSLNKYNPLGIADVSLGICLTGRNTSFSNENPNISGCWNGGELITMKQKLPIHEPVPNGPENCVRCRWFITDASKLPELTSHANMLSYKAYMSANQAQELEKDLEILKDKRYECEAKDIPFLENTKLINLERRYEKQTIEADEYTKDYLATFRLITKIIEIEKRRILNDNSEKLIAVGNEGDLIPQIKFIETESELFHLSILCDDAELYPDIYDELKKTPAIQKRTLHLSKVFQKINKPFFMEMNEEQQFITGNAIIRRMAKLTGNKDKLKSFEIVGDYLETKKYLLDKKLLNDTIKEIKLENPLLISYDNKGDKL